MDSLRKQFLLNIIKKTEQKLSKLKSEYHELEQTGPAPGDAWAQHDAMVAAGLCKAADEHTHMNRYSNLYPYDKNRFELQSTTPDYINASWINLSGEKRKLIITMAPLHPSSFNSKTQTDFGQNSAVSTCGQFWRMVLEARCKLVIMLCKLEKGYQGCSQYFPEEGEDTFGGVSVALRCAEVMSEACVHRQFDLQEKEKLGDAHVDHLQFPLWPNYGVVDNIEQFAQFVVLVNEKWDSLYEKEETPLIVHCSGGIGRSGTFTTVLTVYRRLIQFIKTGDKGELSGILEEEGEGGLYLVPLVRTMREQRHPWMVEGQAQYNLAYNTLLHLIRSLVK